MKMKWLAKIVICVVAASVSLCAEPIKDLHPSGYVNDFAGALDAATVAQLTNICRQIDEKAHAQIAVVTIKSLDGDDIDDYAVNLFKQWGIGPKSNDHGVLILVAVEDRRYRTEVGYGLEPILPDGKVGGFGREAVPYFKQNDYSGAITLMTTRVANVIAQDAGITLTGVADTPAPPVPQRHERLPPSVIGLLVVIFIIVMFIPPLRRALFWIILFSSSGGGGYRGGGGGFGGGGGGFGGFGGGGSGGGGASGGW